MSPGHSFLLIFRQVSHSSIPLGQELCRLDLVQFAFLVYQSLCDLASSYFSNLHSPPLSYSSHTGFLSGAKHARPTAFLLCTGHCSVLPQCSSPGHGGVAGSLLSFTSQPACHLLRESFPDYSD